jgi:hypothetical protein
LAGRRLYVLVRWRSRLREPLQWRKKIAHNPSNTSNPNHKRKRSASRRQPVFQLTPPVSAKLKGLTPQVIPIVRQSPKKRKAQLNDDVISQTDSRINSYSIPPTTTERTRQTSSTRWLMQDTRIQRRPDGGTPESVRQPLQTLPILCASQGHT